MANRKPPTSKSGRKPIPRRVWLLSWVSCVADISGEMTHPVLPLFLIGVLGVSNTQIGIIDGTAVLLIAVLNAVAGARSDRTGRRMPWVRAGYALPIVGKVILAVAGNWWAAFFGRSLDRLGKGMRGAPRDAMLAASVDAEDHGRVFGVHRAVDTAGAVVGGLIAAGVLFWFARGEGAGESVNADHGVVYRVIFGVAAAIGIGAIALTLLVRESPEDAARARPEPKTGGPEKRAPLPRAYWATLTVLTLFSLAASSDAFLLLRAREAGFAAWTVVLLYVAFNVAYALFSYPAGVFSDRIGRWRVICAGWVAYALVYAGFALVPSSQSWALWPLMGVYGLSIALTEGVGRALIADHTPPGRHGLAMGVFHCVTGVATFAASLLAGAIWDASGSTPALLLAAGCAVAAVIALGVLHALGLLRGDGGRANPSRGGSADATEAQAGTEPRR